MELTAYTLKGLSRCGLVPSVAQRVQGQSEDTKQIYNNTKGLFHLSQHLITLGFSLT